MAGYTVYDAPAVKEVLYLCEHHKIDAVVIAADVEDPEIVEAQMRHTTMKLKSSATVKDVIWELEDLLGGTEKYNNCSLTEQSSAIEWAEERVAPTDPQGMRLPVRRGKSQSNIRDESPTSTNVTGG